MSLTRPRLKRRRLPPLPSLLLRCAAAVLLLAVVAGGRAQEDRGAAPSDRPSLVGLLARALAGKAPAAALGVEAEGRNGAAADGAPADSGVARRDSGLLDLHVKDMELATLLEALSYEARANIVASTSVQGRVTANLYAVTLTQALDAVLIPNKYAFVTVGNTIYVGTPDEMAALRPAPPPIPPVTRVIKLRYLRPKEAAAAVKAVLSADAAIIEGAEELAAGGKGAGPDKMSGAGVDYLIVTDQAERLERAERLLAEIDVRPRQVLIEATVLRATLNESNQFGIDFTMLGGIDFRGVAAQSNASADITLGQLPRGRLEDYTVNTRTDFAANVADGGFSMGIIHNNVAAFIRALEEVTDVVVVANPKVVALNKQQGEVIVGRRDGYMTTTVTETAAVQSIEFLETGTQIKFRPLINEDGTVRLAVHPKDSNGGLNAANLPFEETTEAHADILVHDGNTVLIGGLFRERTVASKSQIPGVGEIPGVGLLFGSRNDQTMREEVIILLTVHILKESPAEREAFRGLLEDVERVRVGARRGLVLIGRERLAQAYFQEALRQLDRGCRDLAIFDLRMALMSEPKHLSALKLLERLRYERTWEDEGTRMRAFVLELLPPETPPLPQPITPAFERPQPALLEREEEALYREQEGAP